MPGTWRHLAARFFGVLRSRPLASLEAAYVEMLLNPAERSAFFAQPAIDQRHAYDAAVSIDRLHAGRRDLQRAALLHDIGKRHARLGVIGRVLASLVAKLHLPVRGRYRQYLDHGPLAAAELAELGAESLVVDFARHHHGVRPESFDRLEWDALQQADGDPRKQRDR